jgi:hypothetical protein
MKYRDTFCELGIMTVSDLKLDFHIINTYKVGS